MKSFFESCLERLIDAKNHFKTFENLSQVSKVDRASLSRWLSGDRKPSLYEIGKVFDVMGVRLSDENLLSDFKNVPLISAKAGAGSSLLTEDAVDRYISFPADFFAEYGFLAPKKAFLIKVLGDSMLPSICDGDIVMVDGNDQVLKDSSIFLVGIGEELLVKMLQRTPKGWLLVSKNRDYAPIPVEEEELENLRVYGRVRWVSRAL